MAFRRFPYPVVIISAVYIPQSTVRMTLCKEKNVPLAARFVQISLCLALEVEIED